GGRAGAEAEARTEAEAEAEAVITPQPSATSVQIYAVLHERRQKAGPQAPDLLKDADQQLLLKCLDRMRNRRTGSVRLG
ncbi:MAG: hypothetical protein ACT4QD_11125, partial [Acidobacteriota bacterium]